MAIILLNSSSVKEGICLNIDAESISQRVVFKFCISSFNRYKIICAAGRILFLFIVQRACIVITSAMAGLKLVSLHLMIKNEQLA